MCAPGPPRGCQLQNHNQQAGQLGIHADVEGGQKPAGFPSPRGNQGALPALRPPDPWSHTLMHPQVWCGSYRPEFAIQSIKTDVHSPLKYRQVRCTPPPCPPIADQLLQPTPPQGAGLPAEPACLRQCIQLRPGLPHAPQAAVPHLVAEAELCSVTRATLG